MKIKTKTLDYEVAIKLPRAQHKLPKKPNFILRSIVRLLSNKELKATNFKYSIEDGISLKDGPFLILMNHSSFIDLNIVSKIFYPKPYAIVCTSDGFVAKEFIMRNLGCIPTNKFCTDLTLFKDISYMLKTKNVSVLMYPEASYSFDGRATSLPRNMGVLFKRLNVPVLYIQTYGAFARDPLYNGLQKRKVNVSAKLKCLFSLEDLKNNTISELNEKLDQAFSFDNFAWQYNNKIEITENFRADGLERILYKCPNCKKEGYMLGQGIQLICKNCGKIYTLNTLGRLESSDGTPEFTHIPDWYDWERSCVRDEILKDRYKLNAPVKIGLLLDKKAIYMVGNGTLTHTKDGFSLKGCKGKLEYKQGPLASYSLYADFFWYEIGDIICIGDKNALFYCFPEIQANISVSKARMAAEEIYKLEKNNNRDKNK